MISALSQVCFDLTLKVKRETISKPTYFLYKRGGWVCLRGPVIQANGRLIFEDDLRSGGLLGFTTQ
jgi:hypothetical protein